MVYNKYRDGRTKMHEERPPAVRRAPEFLFVSGNAALDFVNTRPLLQARPTELLSDFNAVLRWFVAAKLLDQKAAGEFHKRWGNTAAARACCQKLLLFREQLRSAVVAIESGKTVSRKMLDSFNRLLSRHALPAQLVFSNGTLKREQRFEPQKPSDLLAPLLDTAADLFSSFDPHRLRKCESCVLHFHDATKNATRRWCSMKLCGNRAKVAKYAARHRPPSRPES
jgi:predicted RNA-binding Zn ribbon-like protein